MSTESAARIYDVSQSNKALMKQIFADVSRGDLFDLNNP